MKNTIIIRLQDSNNLQESKQQVKINKLVSSILPLDFIKLLKKADNKVNPRSAKINKITKGIHETLEISPELFWYKSKGILLATENCNLLDRNRVSLSFDNLDFEGIMDGGHNTFAIATYLIEKLFDKKLKDWNECKTYWEVQYEEILEEFDKNSDKFSNFSIPVEIIFPKDEDGALDQFYNYIAEICAARNNNVQLTEASKGNQVGLYDHLQKNLDKHFDIVWRSGTSGVIKSEDVLSISSIPLIFMQEKKLLPKDLSQLNPVSIYSQKGRCVDFFNSILEHKDVSVEDKGKHTLKNSYVESGLDLVEDIMRFFDKLFVEFPSLYNKISPGFGRIKSVDDGTKNKSKPKFKPPTPKPTLFRTKKSKTSYPLGFIYPLITGVTELIEINQENKRLRWIVSPMAINLEELEMAQYIDAIKLANYDPQTVGKQNLFYSQAKSIFSTYILRKVSHK